VASGRLTHAIEQASAYTAPSTAMGRESPAPSRARAAGTSMKISKLSIFTLLLLASNMALADPVALTASAVAALGGDGIAVIAALAGTGKYIAFGVCALGGPAARRRKARWPR
jgi:hypothetical protein